MPHVEKKEYSLGKPHHGFGSLLGDNFLMTVQGARVQAGSSTTTDQRRQILGLEDVKSVGI